MERLTFFVIGSEGNRYKVTFEGDGETLQSFCTCPAFKMGGAFCKHAAQMLVGDMTRLDLEMTAQFAQEATSALKILKSRSAMSPLMEKAIEHDPTPPPKRMEVGSPEEAWNILERLARSRNIVTRRHKPDDHDPNAHGVEFFVLGKSGRIKKHPLAKIVYSEFRFEYNSTIDDKGNFVERPVVVPRTMKWTTQVAKKFKSFGSIERAAAELQEWLLSQS